MLFLNDYTMVNDPSPRMTWGITGDDTLLNIYILSAKEGLCGGFYYFSKSTLGSIGPLTESFREMV